MSAERLYAKYLIETAHPLEQAAEIMAGEQSAGTFVRVPGETDELREKHGARVESIHELENVPAPALPGSKPPKNDPMPSNYTRAEVVLSFPFANVGASLAALMTTVAGNLYELAPFSGLRLMDLRIPTIFGETYPGPQFGVAGTRKLAGVYERPIIGTIIKPSVGLSPEQTAELTRALCKAGLDFIKDDELIANPPYSPLKERVQAVMAVINEHAQKTGKKVMYAFNITADLEDMLRHHDEVLEAGGSCVMVNLIPVGLVATAALRRRAQLPIHGHRNGWGALSRHPLLGMSIIAFQKFWRLAGVDHFHVNGLRNKFCESDESVIAAARECLKPLWPHAPYTAMPVFSSGQWAGQAPDTFAALGSCDLMYLAGGGIMAHPGGPEAGVKSIQQGWEAAMRGIPLEEYAKEHMELRQAIEMYGAL